jgi:hypothetical protein
VCCRRCFSVGVDGEKLSLRDIACRQIQLPKVKSGQNAIDNGCFLCSNVASFNGSFENFPDVCMGVLFRDGWDGTRGNEGVGKNKYCRGHSHGSTAADMWERSRKNRYATRRSTKHTQWQGHKNRGGSESQEKAVVAAGRYLLRDTARYDRPVRKVGGGRGSGKGIWESGSEPRPQG